MVVPALCKDCRTDMYAGVGKDGANRWGRMAQIGGEGWHTEGEEESRKGVGSGCYCWDLEWMMAGPLHATSSATV